MTAQIGVDSFFKRLPKSDAASLASGINSLSTEVSASIIKSSTTMPKPKKRVASDSEKALSSDPAKPGKKPKISESGNPPQVQFKSPAEFFANNKNIAGFDNPGKSLYTTIREFIENSLDAAESIGQSPDIFLTVEEMTQSQLNAMKGIEVRERVNEKLYLDYESEKQKAKRREKESKIPVLDVAADSSSTEDPSLSQPKVSDNKGAMYYKVTVKDNGAGMPHEDIPNMLGRVLAGTKYGVKQTRGKFGLGAKMALIWSKMSTGFPVEIKSARIGSSFISECKLDIDIYKNQPEVIIHKKVENVDEWHGTEISIIIEGSWTTYRAKILHYMRQLAIITPYAHFEFRFVADREAKSFGIRYARRTDVMPPPAVEVKYHPSSVNLLLMKKLLDEAKSRKQTFLQFLTEQFTSIDHRHALNIINELGSPLTPRMKADHLTDEHLTQLYQLFKEMKFSPPDGQCLSPAGEYNLRLGIMKELNPDMVATYQEKTRVFEGHPFIVEAAVSLGGRTVNSGLNIYRFANRIPLLFEAGADVVTRTASRKINWGLYKIKQNIDKIGVFVSIVSTKIPFKGTGKEYIGDDIEEIASAVKHALQQCCLQLKVKLTRAADLRSRHERKLNLTKYIPTVAKAICVVLNKASEKQKDGKETVSRKNIDTKAINENERSDLIGKLLKNEVSEKIISAKLLEHVEKSEFSQAFDYVVTKANEGTQMMDLNLVPINYKRHYLEMHAGNFTVQLIDLVS